MRAPLALLLAGLFVAPVEEASAQYFGRNKIVYEHLRFHVLETGNFDIYYTPDKYPEGATARINVMGALIFQIHYVYPFQRPEKGWHWAFTLSPGW